MNERGKPRVEAGFQRQTVKPSSQETEQIQSLLLHALVFLAAGCNRNASEETNPVINGRKEQFGL